MRWPRDFTALLLRFAETVSAVGDMDREEALRTWTPFYLNLGELTRSFDPLAPTRQEFVTGIVTSDDPAEWAHSIYLDHAMDSRCRWDQVPIPRPATSRLLVASRPR
jgi:hypothetical protein